MQNTRQKNTERSFTDFTLSLGNIRAQVKEFQTKIENQFESENSKVKYVESELEKIKILTGGVVKNNLRLNLVESKSQENHDDLKLVKPLFSVVEDNQKYLSILTEDFKEQGHMTRQKVIKIEENLA